MISESTVWKTMLFLKFTSMRKPLPISTLWSTSFWNVRARITRRSICNQLDGCLRRYNAYRRLSSYSKARVWPWRIDSLYWEARQECYLTQQCSDSRHLLKGILWESTASKLVNDYRVTYSHWRHFYLCQHFSVTQMVCLVFTARSVIKAKEMKTHR